MTVGTDEIADRISNVLVARLRAKPDSIAEAATLDADLGATSLDMVETIMTLEDEFGIEISDRDAETLKTVGDVMALVRAKLHEHPQAAQRTEVAIWFGRNAARMHATD